jgi:hypothetical protein
VIRRYVEVLTFLTFESHSQLYQSEREATSISLFHQLSFREVYNWLMSCHSFVKKWKQFLLKSGVWKWWKDCWFRSYLTIWLVIFHVHWIW